MKKYIILLLFFTTHSLFAQKPMSHEQHLKAWQEARFGMFIHWGPISIKGVEISHTRGKEIPIEEYDNLYKQFNPINFNADEWVSIAKAAGMKYMILTAKHHDGFCLWDTKQTDYNIMNAPFKRDIVKELAAACKKQGLAFGTYYSTCDWHHPDFPLTSPGGSKVREVSNLDAYTTYLKRQIAELLLNYGSLEALWFDVPQKFDSIRGQGVIDFARGLQPDILINNRTGAKGDFDTPEQRVGKMQMERPWETCMTIAQKWSWRANDKVKTLRDCVIALTKSAAGDGNLLLNVGPNQFGIIEPEQVIRLKELGEWLKKNGETIYGTRGGPYLAARNWASTRKDSAIYVHIFKNIGKTFTLPALPVKIVSVSFLNGEKVKFKQSTENVTLDLPILKDTISNIIKIQVDKPTIEISLIDPKDAYLATASNFYRNNPQVAPSMLVDKSTSHQSTWQTDEDKRQAWVEIDLRKVLKIDAVILNEIATGKIKKFSIDYKKGDKWLTIYEGTKIGEQLICPFKKIETQYIRLNILDSDTPPGLSEIDVRELHF